ncbi:ABC transporter ATP-binding protein [Lacticaseibacillus absianus]|uniref:ABC transporter ATP-binding protein n=1 Tax=Lacticaseibacillus absianus TaxID=2729623 RepID=UPI0015C77E88|nr:ABC transporter ATP-binding protein [Lacticaseibacillus absianus]
MVIAIEHLTKKFQQTTVLDDVSVEIQPGEFFVLVGPSGSGKSTLLRMIAGLTTVTAGQIRTEAGDLTRLPPKDRHLAMVFQNYALLPFLTVAENVRFGLENLGLSEAEKTVRVREALALVHLENLADRRPKALSGGQQQRVALARALATKADTILMDEPLSNLDAQLRAEMRTEIMRLHREIGMTLIYVTHDQVEAMTMGDRIMVVEGHRVQQVGTPLDLYNHPANTFVAGFIGTPQMNWFELTVMPDQRHYRLAGADTVRPLPMPLAAGQYRLGVRPEHLVTGRTRGPHALAVTVDAVQQLGDQTLVFAGDRVSATSGQLDVFVGESRYFTLPEAPDHWHLFSVATGARIGMEAATVGA